MLCAFDKEKLLTASLLAEASGGGGGHYKVDERLEVSVALVMFYHDQGLMSLDETRCLMTHIEKKPICHIIYAEIQCYESRQLIKVKSFWVSARIGFHAFIFKKKNTLLFSFWP